MTCTRCASGWPARGRARHGRAAAEAAAAAAAQEVDVCHQCKRPLSLLLSSLCGNSGACELCWTGGTEELLRQPNVDLAAPALGVGLAWQDMKSP